MTASNHLRIHKLTIAFVVMLVSALCVPSNALSTPAKPQLADVYAAAEFREGADPGDTGHDLYFTWTLVRGATAYHVSSPSEGWSFICRSSFETVTPDDPRAPVVRDVGLDILFSGDGWALWRLPLGAVANRSGGRSTVFPAGTPIELEVRALEGPDTPLSQASDPATTTFEWRDQPVHSALSVVPTPWGVRVSGSTSATGPGGPRVLGGRIEASFDGKVFRRVQQYSPGAAEPWSDMTVPVPGMSQLVFGADPTVWPRLGLVSPGVLTYGRVRIGTTPFDPRVRAVWYRQRHTVEIQEIPDGSRRFFRFGASSAVKRHVPRQSPSMRQVSVSYTQRRGTKVWRSTIGSAAAAKGRITWTLWATKDGAAGGPTTPATDWRKVVSGSAAYGAGTSTTTPYLLRVPISRIGAYRLDVTYGGSSVARPDGYSKYFVVR